MLSQLAPLPARAATGSFKVVLINPYELGRQPFALAEPAAWLKREGFAVSCLDLSLEKLDPESEAFKTRWAELSKRKADYEHYRLYPEMPDWEVMGFYPMNKRRDGSDNWYMLDFAARKRLMGGHARVGRKYAGRISQMITGSTGLDDWEWGVTLMAHQADAIKEIVYEMRFDEVSARYGEFGTFYLNLRLAPAALWEHLRL